MVAHKKNPAEANLKDNAPEGMDLSDAQIKAARTEGAKQDVQENAKEVHRALTDGNLPGEPPAREWHGHDEIQMWAHNLDLSVEELKKKVGADPDSDQFIPDEKVYGLLALERNGKNRTEYVKMLMDRLKLKADELPGGGPSYTNDISNITKL